MCSDERRGERRVARERLHGGGDGRRKAKKAREGEGVVVLSSRKGV